MQNNTKLINFALIGFMGTGKSTIGAITARRLKYGFVDTDKLIEQRLNLSINQIFTRFGEQYFRKIESKIIEECSKQDGLIIATGGGAVLNPLNIRNLRSSGLVIHLKAREEIIYRNISANQDRPLLRGCDDPMKRIGELLSIRSQLYKENDFEIDVSDMTVEQAVNELIRYCQAAKQKS